MKSGNLKFLEPSAPLQACNGPALPLPLHLPLQEFFIDMPDDGLRKGRNMWQTCKGTI